ncbi:hypothetical protein H8A95_19890 [Bradyrhizobium sp. Pear76]|uniref:hypothetical protein n=1 Tax=Bradyrhizobium oropedii TaxID=1571201 RepID=UPI001E4FF3C9|nr:hypothetical protein [Bradyrhizobium oropedii]MCC8964516.1 hypothetical protein [Bradyrhizobium oropedii]
MKVWIYTDANKQVGDRDHLKVFATDDVADEWFKANDPEGVAFEYEVLGPRKPVPIGGRLAQARRTPRGR